MIVQVPLRMPVRGLILLIAQSVLRRAIMAVRGPILDAEESVNLTDMGAKLVPILLLQTEGLVQYIPLVVIMDRL